MPTAPTPDLTIDQITGIVQRRQAALLEKYIAGKATPQEQAEIAHIIAQLKPTSEPDTPRDNPPAFALESDAPKRRTGYLHPLDTYATRYGADLRSIKRWIATGRDADPADPCPLDDPKAMPSWWTRRKSQRVPERLLLAANSATTDADSKNPKASATAISHAPPPPGPESERDTILSNIEGMSLSEQVSQLRRTVAINLEMLNRVLLSQSPDEATLTIRQRNYERSLEQLRKLEKTDQENRLAAGELVKKADVRADLGSLLSSLAIMRESMAQRIADRVPSLNTEQRAQVVAAIEITRLREESLLRSAAEWSPADLPALLSTDP